MERTFTVCVTRKKANLGATFSKLKLITQIKDQFIT